MRCAYFDAGACRSCTLMGVPHARQVGEKEARARALLDARVDWLPPVVGAERAFRNRAKMVVGGSIEAPTLGILDAHHRGVDLRECGVTASGIRAALPAIATFIGTARIAPYDVASRRGELKHVLVTESPDGELMVRFVLRSTECLPRIRKHLPALLAELPTARVVSANLLPTHVAVLEGEEEIVLTPDDALRLRLGSVTLRLPPKAFFQTNTWIAKRLYEQAAAWTDELGPASVWDLYCGIGGFALHLAAAGRQVVGVESSAAAIDAARASARECGLAARIVQADATRWAAAQTAESLPELVVVNPPRRGLGAALSEWLEHSAVPHVIYSSCNPDSLAADLALMPSLRPVRARLFDMFPHTEHCEVMVLLARA